jgi:transposase-like protein
MDDIAKDLIVPKKRNRREFSLEEKQKLFEQWKVSGLNKNQFCKQHDLVLSAFSKWCRQFMIPKANDKLKNYWTPVLLKANEATKEEVTVEVAMPNQMTMRFRIKLSSLNGLLKELYHAPPIVR